MQELKSATLDSYRRHPAFDFARPSLQVPSGLLHSFNQAYGVACQIAATLDQKSFAAFLGDCKRSLEAIFLSLAAQTSEPLELRFLEELRRATLRLMEEELTWYGRRPNSKGLPLPRDRVREDAARLFTQRHFFGQLPAAAVTEILGMGQHELAKFRANAQAGRLTRDDLSANSGPAIRSICSVLNREYKALGVLDAVSAYTGRKTRVTGLALELSVPQASWWKNAIAGLDRPPNTLYAHLDETIACPKSIVYLTDVTQANGPTSCYPEAYEAMQLNPLQEMIGRVVGTVGSSPELKDYYKKTYHQSTGSENFRRHFMLLPESLRFNSHLGWDVLPGSELETQLVGVEHAMTGPAGTFIAFDGARLLHRGGLMQSGERIALQVIFSDTTILQQMVNRTKRMLA